MRALLSDTASTYGVRLAEVPDPEPEPHQALVEVVAAGMNFGEVALAAGQVDGVPRLPDGMVLGADAVGVVVRPAEDGSAPGRGSTVVTFNPAGGWAQLRAVDTDALAVVPGDADPAALTTVPVAGLTALRALHRAGPLQGRRILVTGATGGVGAYAVQLAQMGGAEVVATTSDPDRNRDALVRLGAADVFRSAADVDMPLDAVLDMLGGPELVHGFRSLRENGVLVAVGHSSDTGETFAFGDLFGEVGRAVRTITTFHLTAFSAADLAPDLSWLAGQVAAGRIDPRIAWHDDWTRYDEAAAALLGRSLGGKAVLRIS